MSNSDNPRPSSFCCIDSPYLMPFDGKLILTEQPTVPAEQLSKEEYKAQLMVNSDALYHLQHKMYADNCFSVLLIFQALDAAGKDSTIRKVFSGINPAGFQVHNFKQPSAQELDHDFLWRTSKALPERGRIGIFNRSYYEEVLVVRVHPKYLLNQNLPNIHLDNLATINSNHQFWAGRYQSINDHEAHLARNGTIILKFFLNVSQQEQHQRFLSRIKDPEKNWKFSSGDIEESQLWDTYQYAYQQALSHTSRPWAPWYIIPADYKPAMRAIVSKLVLQNIRQLPLSFPELSSQDQEALPIYESLLSQNTNKK
ncbi:PPK2 family polyphosphate kinase [Kangiella koreensis]|uniref:Polyphosphate:AMP phosphotransferase n=1 Tax=Kangiella koreensis (strain DSM 16069 / JCM 12317 / KCTC 12182 / SW-125) TaxID=523791 RepID=C7R5Z7_KANKD|nr:polyphosphate--nucleotide phosphotransferase [Kangiella koreensis]ACV25428.1 Polyphosphate:AMP phosphotransferase [Kangiella koreensis DSM 16069]